MTPARFTLRPIHLQLMRRAVLRWEGGKYGAPALNCKRPYGNSDVEDDILKIALAKPEGNDGYEPCWSSTQREWARNTHEEMLNAIQIVLQLQTFETGQYVTTDSYGFKWKKVATP